MISVVGKKEADAKTVLTTIKLTVNCIVADGKDIVKEMFNQNVK